MLDFLLDLLLGAAAGAAIVATVVTVKRIIDKRTIQNEVKVKCPDAFKALIKQKKENAINVGIFDHNDNELVSDMSIESEQGVSSDLCVGQIIYV